MGGGPVVKSVGHVIRDAEIPPDGENFHFLDPAGRNFFMLWVRRRPEGAYVYREWPSRYHIPGIGVPDPWAVPSSRNPSKGNDGDRGPAQSSWGFSLLRYKFEFARLERWVEWGKWSAEGVGPDEVPGFDVLEEWSEEEGAEEPITCRYVDARPASAPKLEQDRVTTLHTELNAMGMWWALSPANLILDDVQKIQDALEMGRLWVAEGCVNLRWALSNWTGADGDKGACKDPIDCLRWYFGSGLGEWQAETAPGTHRRHARARGPGMMMQQRPAARRPQPPGAPRVRWRGR